MFVSIPSRRRPRRRWATWTLAALMAAAWAAMLLVDDRGALMARWGTLADALPDSAQGWHAAFAGGRIASLLTALFVHADAGHLLGNLLFLLILGLPAERALGPWRLLLLFAIGGALANLAAAAAVASPERMIVGASGAVAALAGAWLSLFPRASVGIVLPLGLFLEWVRAPAALLIAVWALLQLLFTFVGPAFGAVAWWAHVTGFVLGLVAGVAWRAGLRRRGAGGE